MQPLQKYKPVFYRDKYLLTWYA